MSDILRSAVEGYVPTVNQLETTILGIGYNRADAKLYGLKVLGGVKSVVLLNGGGGDPYEHPAYTPISQTLSGATVLASFSSDGIGSVTGLTTRTLTLSDLGYSALWKRTGTLLEPVTAGDNVFTTGQIYAGDDIYDAGVIATSRVTAGGKVYAPGLYTSRRGTAGGAVQSSDIMGYWGAIGYYDSNNTRTGFQIDITATQTWSSTQSGTSVNMKSIANGLTVQKSRIFISGDGYVTINEDGEATNFRVEGDTDQNLFLVDGVNDKVGIGTGGTVSTKFHVKGSTTWGQSLIKIEQLDEDKGFIEFTGTSAANGTKNISTHNGSGSVTGPKAQAGSEDYWRFDGMLRQTVNGAEAWIPYYSFIAGT